MDNGLRFLEMIRKPSPIDSEVSFHFLSPVSLRSRKELKQFLIKMIRTESASAARLSFVFCSDRYLLKLNRKFLAHDFFTDILTFPLDSADGIIQGELYLSIDRIRDNAKQLSVSANQELHRVMFHGVLHLCGYKDKTARQISEIRQKEDLYLKRYFKN